MPPPCCWASCTHCQHLPQAGSLPSSSQQKLRRAETEAHRAWSHSSHHSALSLPPALVGATGMQDRPHPATIPLPRASTQLPSQACHHPESSREGQAEEKT